ncbi:hypothetical protein BDY19DRAFT_1060202 [Irpex rosettiformis]|uniref:Uncharacterized protein n=1 Tax=Irpex rosettiformis TaxID=378272 RepID=A0ACB8TRU7_9APHY|nr:hypothetical protein BDY19DRAFT_1060202 [Irpex rosettiformis]
MRPSQLTTQVQRRRERHEEVEAAVELHPYHHELPMELSLAVSPSPVALLEFVAHALVRLDDGTIVGDPMEMTALDTLNWQMGKEAICASPKTVRVLSAEAHVNDLQSFERQGTRDDRVSVGSVLDFYGDETYKRFMRQVSRVLALGYYEADAFSAEKITNVHRDEVEASLIFVGFLVFHCPLKTDAVEIPQILNDASHRR